MPRVAVLGCGRWGRNLVRTFRELSALGAVADPREDARADAAAIAPSVAIHADPLDAIEDPHIDAVAIAAPAAAHARLVEASIEAHKDVFCEKPLALSLEDAERLVSLAARRGRVLAVGHLSEYQPSIQRLVALVAEGALGTVRFVHAQRCAFGRVRRDEDVLWSFAPHDIAVILRVFGELPVRVSASGWAHLSPRTADIATAQLDFEGGGGAVLFASWVSPAKERKLTVIGSERTAVVDEIAGTLVLHESRAYVRAGDIVMETGGAVTVPLQAVEPLRAECEDFLRACEARDRPLTDGETALDVIRVLDAAQRSMKSGAATPLSRPRLVQDAYAGAAKGRCARG